EFIDSSGSELDRQRYAIESATDFGNNKRVGVAEFRLIETSRCPLKKKLNRRKRQRLRGCEAFDIEGNRQRRKTVNPFGLRAQGRSAGREDADAWKAGEKRFGQSSGCIDDMLAGIEQDEHLFITKMRKQARKRIVG